METTEVDGGRNVSLAPELSPSLAAAEDHFRVKRRALEAVLENCKRALELLEKPYIDLDPAGDEAAEAQPMGEVEGSLPRSESGGDFEADELCALLKSRVESPDFLEKLEHIQTSVYQNIHGDDNASWDMITAKDLWDDKHFDGKDAIDQDDYVLVKQEDIVDGVAFFMATYLLSLKQTKELTPNQLQAALCKTFSVKKKKSRLRKAWDGSKVVYNVASWSATAIGIYQNPALVKAASVAFWSSCRVISKLF
ncbi:uncharacterized protein LOC122029555 isoform X1 [Zingiber officinale]|uniref:uncharacterized protein LOC122029555 isoform X1 n=1 Tax=Zingiber officinale TaxID=94328 RepID=UPI001C4BEB7E|nr:uncharacterized protein LOC122029555 isoform X1 [Zingiber officinale]